jgi:hypothetical protein
MVSAVCVAFYPQTAVVREGALKPLRDAGLYLFKYDEPGSLMRFVKLPHREGGDRILTASC